jgi:hypothetical protein
LACLGTGIEEELRPAGSRASDFTQGAKP